MFDKQDYMMAQRNNTDVTVNVQSADAPAAAKLLKDLTDTAEEHITQTWFGKIKSMSVEFIIQQIVKNPLHLTHTVQYLFIINDIEFKHQHTFDVGVNPSFNDIIQQLYTLISQEITRLMLTKLPIHECIEVHKY